MKVLSPSEGHILWLKLDGDHTSSKLSVFMKNGEKW